MTTRLDDTQEDGSLNDLVQHKVVAVGPHQQWLADMMYISTWTGVVYLANMLGVRSQRIVGWLMRVEMKAGSCSTR